MAVIEASSKISCLATKNSMKLRWHVDEASMAAFSVLCVNGPWVKVHSHVWEEMSAVEMQEKNAERKRIFNTPFDRRSIGGTFPLL